MNIEKLSRFIRGRKVSLLSSIDSDGYPNIKAVLRPRRIEGIKTFFFSTNKSSLRVEQYSRNSKASI